jgi:hypothetical protein
MANRTPHTSFFGRFFRVPAPLLVERLLALTLLGALVWAYIEFREIGYLPLPFWPDPQDVYADGISTAWWSFNGAMYNIWKSVYPPLSFVIPRIFSFGHCYNADVTFARDCDWGLWTAELLFWLLNAAIAFFSYRKFARATALPRAIGLMLGLPMLYTFEHLNLLMFAYTGLFLAFAPIVRSARTRFIGMAIAVNLKVYLIVVLFGQLFKRRWRWAEGCLIMTIAIYAMTYFWIGHGTPKEVMDNILIFSSDPERASGVNYVFYATTYNSMVQLINSSAPLMPSLGSWPLEFLSVFLTWLVHAIQALVIFTLLAVWYRPEVVTRQRLAAICYLFVLISNETGGYTTAGAVFLVFFEPWKGVGRPIALVSAWILCLAIDFDVAPLYAHKVNGYFSGRPVWQDVWLSVGPFARPGFILLMEIGLVIATWGDFLRYRREQRRSPEPALS